MVKENEFKFLYENKISLFDKIKTIATEIYDAKNVIANKKIKDQLYANFDFQFLYIQIVLKFPQ